MTTEQWLEQAARDQDVLKALVRDYHPVNRQAGRRPQDFITAPNAEAACTQVRRHIRDEARGDPVARFETALTTRDASGAMTVLSEAWFGVPESATCWGITGFSEAVALLEDPPGDELEEADVQEPAR